jgi:hypothetical protein
MLLETMQGYDSYDNFPNDSDKKTRIADNMITIGALNFQYDDK